MKFIEERKGPGNEKLNSLRQDCDRIIGRVLEKVMPDSVVREALEGYEWNSCGKVILVAAGKAAWTMGCEAVKILGERMTEGIMVTKYGHLGDRDSVPGMEKVRCFEAGHPVPDENSFLAAEEVLKLTENLNREDRVVFLLSGGGSSVFEKPLVSGEELQNITDQLLAAGADILEINSIRKRLSAVKGGRFAAHCAPAEVISVILSDIIGDPVDMIASGPTCADSSTCRQAAEAADKYGIAMSDEARALLEHETEKIVPNAVNIIGGGVGHMCRHAEAICRSMGYRTVFLTDRLACEAREAGRFFGAVAAAHGGNREYGNCSEEKTAYIAGGETVVHIRGKGRGGRNQEMALAAAAEMKGTEGAVFFSVGSDGTDGPTDAAGGIADGRTAEILESLGTVIYDVLDDNDSYSALEASGDLIMTGPTGTNVNDLSVLLTDSRYGRKENM